MYSSLLINIFVNYFLKLSLQQNDLKFRKNALIITFSAFLARTSLAFSKPEQILDELQCEREKRNWKRKLKLRLRLFLKPIGILKFILMVSLKGVKMYYFHLFMIFLRSITF